MLDFLNVLSFIGGLLVMVLLICAVAIGVFMIYNADEEE